MPEGSDRGWDQNRVSLIIITQKKRRHFWLRFSYATFRMDRQATSRQGQSAKSLQAEPSLAYSFSLWIRSRIFNEITVTTVDPPKIINSIHCGHGNSIWVTSPHLLQLVKLKNPVWAVNDPGAQDSTQINLLSANIVFSGTSFLCLQ